MCLVVRDVPGCDRNLSPPVGVVPWEARGKAPKLGRVCWVLLNSRNDAFDVSVSVESTENSLVCTSRSGMLSSDGATCAIIPSETPGPNNCRLRAASLSTHPWFPDDASLANQG